MAIPTVTVLPGGQSFTCVPEHHVLEAVARSGTRSVDIGCRRGGCGVCRIRVIEGTFTTKVMSKAYCTADEIASGVVLACRTFPTGDLVIEPCPKPKPVRAAGSGTTSSATQ
jgi:ferredoxin